eukprot:1142615-Prymnesium_polylepis.2
MVLHGVHLLHSTAPHAPRSRAPAKALHDGVPMQQVCARQQAHRAPRRRSGDWRRPRSLHEAGIPESI